MRLFFLFLLLLLVCSSARKIDARDACAVNDFEVGRWPANAPNLFQGSSDSGGDTRMPPNRTCAVVGKSVSLVYGQWGALIDDADLVLRVPLRRRYTDVYGDVGGIIGVPHVRFWVDNEGRNLMPTEDKFGFVAMGGAVDRQRVRRTFFCDDWPGLAPWCRQLRRFYRRSVTLTTPHNDSSELTNEVPVMYTLVMVALAHCARVNVFGVASIWNDRAQWGTSEPTREWRGLDELVARIEALRVCHAGLAVYAHPTQRCWRVGLARGDDVSCQESLATFAAVDWRRSPFVDAFKARLESMRTTGEWRDDVGRRWQLSRVMLGAKRDGGNDTDGAAAEPLFASCAVVGRAPWLTAERFGTFIDSHALVVRKYKETPHAFVDRLLQHRAALGIKVDVVYSIRSWPCNLHFQKPGSLAPVELRGVRYLSNVRGRYLNVTRRPPFCLTLAPWRVLDRAVEERARTPLLLGHPYLLGKGLHSGLYTALWAMRRCARTSLFGFSTGYHLGSMGPAFHMPSVEASALAILNASDVNVRVYADRRTQCEAACLAAEAGADGVAAFRERTAQWQRRLRAFDPEDAQPTECLPRNGARHFYVVDVAGARASLVAALRRVIGDARTHVYASAADFLANSRTRAPVGSVCVCVGAAHCPAAVFIHCQRQLRVASHTYLDTLGRALYASADDVDVDVGGDDDGDGALAWSTMRAVARSFIVASRDAARAYMAHGAHRVVIFPAAADDAYIFANRFCTDY